MTVHVLVSHSRVGEEEEEVTAVGPSALVAVYLDGREMAMAAGVVSAIVSSGETCCIYGMVIRNYELMAIKRSLKSSSSFSYL